MHCKQTGKWWKVAPTHLNQHETLIICIIIQECISIRNFITSWQLLLGVSNTLFLPSSLCSEFGSELNFLSILSFRVKIDLSVFNHLHDHSRIHCHTKFHYNPTTTSWCLNIFLAVECMFIVGIRTEFSLPPLF